MRTSFLLLLCLALLRPLSTVAQSYCNPSYTAGTSLGDFIDGVQFGTINNVGSGGMGGPAYNNYTTAGPEFVALVNPSDEYPITITAGAWDHGTGTGVDQYSVWIDLDRNGSFSVAEKLASAEATTPGQTLQLTVSIPSVLHGGYTRMRVMCTYDTDPNDACGSYEAGETEDYALVIDDERPCMPLFAYGPADGDYIQDVQFEGIQQLSSGAPSPYTSYVYADAGLAATVQPGQTYPMTIRSGVYDPQDASEYYTVWVDLDRSGDFSANEKLAVGTTDAPFQQLTLDVPIPANATNGYTWIRVLCTYEEDPAQGCGPFNYGEAEDYTLIISNGDVCIPPFTWQAVEGDFVRAVQIGDLDWYTQLTPPLWGYTDYTAQYGAHLTMGSTTQLHVTTGSYVGNQNVYVWLDNGLDGNFQYDFVEHQTVTGPSGVATFNFQVPHYPGYGRLRIACTRDTLDPYLPCGPTLGYGNAIDFAVAINTLGWPCLPLQGYGTHMGDGMDSLTFDGQTYGQLDRFPYHEFSTAHEHQLLAGQNSAVTIVPDSALTETYQVALDMNDDGTFDLATEVLAQQDNGGSDAPFDLPFTIPALCPAGQHILRVRSQYSFQFTPDPCADTQYGEIVDIAVAVSDPDGPCIPFVGYWTTAGDFISGVKLGSIDNTDNGASYDAPYIDYAMSTDLMIGVQDTIHVTSGEFFFDGLGAWIDFNNDQDFNDDYEQIGWTGSAPEYTELTWIVTVPPGTPLGHKRLRVRCWYVGEVDPCTASGYGQTEDYDVNITVNTGVATATIADLRLLPTTDGVQMLSDATLIGHAYSLLDATGRTLSTGRITSDRTDLQMTAFAHGAYTVHVLDGDARQVKRFVW